MEQVYEERRIVGPSICDADGLLSHPAAFNLLQDAASAHAELLGIGRSDLAARSLNWLIIKIKIVFDRRPAYGDEVLLRTWPEKPGPLRCYRSFELLRDKETLLRVRSEWAVFNSAAQRVVPCADIFPPELPFDRPAVCSEPFARIPGRFAGIEPFAFYSVSSSDIDLLGHMNNGAYPRVLFGCFSMAERRAMDPRCVDLLFRSPCYEGDTLAFRKLEHDGVLDICASREEDTVLLARIEPRSAK